MLRRAHVRLSFIPVAAIVLLGLCLLFPAAVTARPDPTKVKDIKTFIACLNMIKKKTASIADAAKCVPPCCNFVLTMSDNSAQAACSLGSCKLPRVIFDCPGPDDTKRFRPSFLLCPIGSKGAGNQFGTDRTELGEDVDDQGSMKMADIPAPPGMTDFGMTTEGGALSKGTADHFGTQGCNAGCHEAAGGGAVDGDNNQLSEPIDPFGKSGTTELAPLVIDTDEPGRSVDPMMRMTLKQICKCIKNNKAKIAQDANDPEVVENPGKRNPTLDPSILLKLCKKLKSKIPKTPACGTPRPTPTPTPTTPPPTDTPQSTPSTTPPPNTPSGTPMSSPTATATHTATATTTSTVQSPTQTPAATGTISPMTTAT